MSTISISIVRTFEILNNSYLTRIRNDLLVGLKNHRHSASGEIFMIYLLIYYHYKGIFL